jgi:hypothetical protein
MRYGFEAALVINCEVYLIHYAHTHTHNILSRPVSEIRNVTLKYIVVISTSL